MGKKRNKIFYKNIYFYCCREDYCAIDSSLFEKYAGYVIDACEILIIIMYSNFIDLDSLNRHSA